MYIYIYIYIKVHHNDVHPVDHHDVGASGSHRWKYAAMLNNKS